MYENVHLPAVASLPLSLLGGYIYRTWVYVDCRMYEFIQRILNELNKWTHPLPLPRPLSPISKLPQKYMCRLKILKKLWYCTLKLYG
jgi:hypothetical protein